MVSRLLGRWQNSGNHLALCRTLVKLTACLGNNRNVPAVLSQFERDLIAERTRSGLAAAKARGKRLGRHKGQNPSDKYAENVLKLIDEGRSYRWISHELQIDKKTVTAIVKRSKVGSK